jgi:hypothetical protein
MQYVAQKATEFLARELVWGPLPRGEILRRADAAGIRRCALEAAKVKFIREWHGRQKYWRLPDPSPAVLAARRWLLRILADHPDGIALDDLRGLADGVGVDWRAVERAKARCPWIMTDRRRRRGYWRLPA